MVKAEATQLRRPERAGQISRTGWSGQSCSGREAWGVPGPQATPLPLCEHRVWPGIHLATASSDKAAAHQPHPDSKDVQAIPSPLPSFPPLNCCPCSLCFAPPGAPLPGAVWLGVQQVVVDGELLAQLPGETEQALCERTSMPCLTLPTDTASHTPSGLPAPTHCFCDHQHTETL